MEMTPETIKALLDAFDGSDWREMVVTVGEDRLHVSRDPLPERRTLPARRPRCPLATPAAAPAAPAAASGGWRRRGPPPLRKLKLPAGVAGPLQRQDPRRRRPSVDGTAIESPVGGAVLARSGSGSCAVRRGGAEGRGAGETVAIVEVMKLMNHVASPVDGVVTAILVENGAPVEFGQAIVVVDPEG